MYVAADKLQIWPSLIRTHALLTEWDVVTRVNLHPACQNWQAESAV